MQSQNAIPTSESSTKYVVEYWNKRVQRWFTIDSFPTEKSATDYLELERKSYPFARFRLVHVSITPQKIFEPAGENSDSTAWQSREIPSRLLGTKK